MPVEFRNPAFNRFGTIDAEINRPKYGWIPFTCDPNDTGAGFDTAELFNRMLPSAAAYVAPTVVEIEAAAAAKESTRLAAIRDSLDNQNSVNKVLLKISFLQENKIRVLEGKAEITAAQFRTWVNGQID